MSTEDGFALTIELTQNEPPAKRQRLGSDMVLVIAASPEASLADTLDGMAAKWDMSGLRTESFPFAKGDADDMATARGFNHFLARLEKIKVAG